MVAVVHRSVRCAQLREARVEVEGRPVSGKQEVSQLHEALAIFGRRGRGLTAARLQSYPSVLVALFGEDALVDAGERQILAERTESALLGIIAGIGDATDRRIAEAVFAAKSEFYDLNVARRQGYIEAVDGVAIRELYKTRRARIVEDVAAALQGVFGAQKTVDHGVLLSPEARRAARQLYRYAQQALVRVEAFELCGRYAQRLQAAFSKARRVQVDLKNIPHGWLWKYSDDGQTVRLIPTSRSYQSDEGLWALAYHYRYLRMLLRDHTGRDYLRENLPSETWESVQLRPTFRPDEIDKMLSVLAESQIDSADVFVDNLCQDSQGLAINEEWRILLALPRVSIVARDLLLPCISLQRVFPEETLVAPGSYFDSVVRSIIWRGVEELGARLSSLEGEDFVGQCELVRDVLKYAPPMYEQYEDGERLREHVWSDELAKPNLWQDWGIQDDNA